MKLHMLGKGFAAEIKDIDLKEPVSASTIDSIEDALQAYGVLVFRDQGLTEADQVRVGEAFGPLDGGLRKATGAASRFSHEALIDIGNVALDGEVSERGDPRLLSRLANQLWHSDSSFQNIAVTYSMLSAVVVPAEGGQTEWCDLKSAYEALPETMQQTLDGLLAVHSAFHSRRLLGDDQYSAEQLARFPPVKRPLVHRHPFDGRKVMHPSVHIESIEGMTVPEGRLLVAELLEHATQEAFVYRHHWRVGDYVMWDNRSTLHRGRRYDLRHRRDLRRTTSLARS
jgi:alpha-ketoglutarate-dependent 2,4-dichlorophenoxyacetate dioxygenase